ncbi:hypothetical protein [Ornithinibacillus scapharcae]|uniref:hypothetical protein n=1 Tax=Ornithinibacillus scapharcae TaxID=1147159 RepID=UPI000225B005|nr:hypothetical protein [Ornithinibacillus scapharcae]
MSAIHNRVKNIIFAFVILLLIVVNVSQYIEKQKYIQYMSDNLMVDFGNMNSSILRANSVLDRILTTKELSQEDASLLKDASVLIASELQDYHQIAVYDLKRESIDNLSDTSETVASDIAIYFSDLFGNLPSVHGSVKLNEYQLEKIKTIKQLSDRWRDEVEVHAVTVNPGQTVEETIDRFLNGNYQEIYEKNAITKEYWVDFLVNLSNKTEAYLNQKNLNTEHGFGSYLSLN